jgi:hypothetical protein
VPELARGASSTLPLSQLEARAWEQALPQPPAWGVLRLAWWKRLAHSPQALHSAARGGFLRPAVELASAPPGLRQVALWSPQLVHLRALGPTSEKYATQTSWSLA